MDINQSEHATSKDAQGLIGTHLANERTCLAWLRTGISLIAVGLGAAHFLDRDLVSGIPVTTLLAAFLVLSGVLLAAMGGMLFTRTREQIEQGNYLATSYGIPTAAGIVIVMGLGCFCMVLLLHYRG